VGKSAQRCAHLSVTANCKSDVDYFVIAGLDPAIHGATPNMPGGDDASKRRVGKSAQRRAHVSVNANCKSDVGTLRFAHPTLAV
jgi:hypothetical protein